MDQIISCETGIHKAVVIEWRKWIGDIRRMFNSWLLEVIWK